MPIHPQNCLALAISLSPVCPPVPPCRVGRSKAVVRGVPPAGTRTPWRGLL